MKPGDPPTLDAAQNMLQNFFSEDRYSLSQVGRLKINEKLRVEEPLDKVVLTRRDIMESVKYLLLLVKAMPVLTLMTLTTLVTVGFAVLENCWRPSSGLTDSDGADDQSARLAGC